MMSSDNLMMIVHHLLSGQEARGRQLFTMRRELLIFLKHLKCDGMISDFRLVNTHVLLKLQPF